MEPAPILESEPPPRNRSGRQWKLGQFMAVIAVVAAFLALARYPFIFGLVVPVVLIALFVGVSIRRRRYDLVAWLIIFYPLWPLLILYVHWSLAIRKIVRRSTPLFDGLIGLSDVGGYLCLLSYVACVLLVAGAAGERLREFPGLKRAAWRVVIFMPIAWIALLVFTLGDPFGMNGYFFR